MARSKKLQHNLELIEESRRPGEYWLSFTSQLGTASIWLTGFSESGRPRERAAMYAWIEEQFQDKHNATESQ